MRRDYRWYVCWLDGFWGDLEGWIWFCLDGYEWEKDGLVVVCIGGSLFLKRCGGCDCMGW